LKKIIAWEKLFDKVSDFKLKQGITSFVNPHSLLILKDHEEIVTNVDYWHIDGISLVKKVNNKFNKSISRYSFDDTSLAPVIFKLAKNNRLKIGIVGTKQEILYSTIHNLERKYSVKIDYFRNGYFNSEEEINASIKEINDHGIEIVICGMGTPFQENYLIKLKKSGWNGFGFSCGGYLHQISEKENYYPHIFDKLNLRWLYRIIKEPKLLKRYMINYPISFILLNKMDR
jgi:exopolysaccharide biosynthesis WecB/TagA/CpsF family protein